MYRCGVDVQGELGQCGPCSGLSAFAALSFAISLGHAPGGSCVHAGMDEISEFLEAEWCGIEPAWGLYRDAFELQTRAATEAILQRAQLQAGSRVLDLASGTGEPAFALARAVGEHGSVVGTDLIAGPLKLLAAEAERRGLAQLRVVRAPMQSLPFEPASFDRVTCRLGLMLCPEPALALREVRRVLCPGGRAVFVVWGDPKQPLFECLLSAWQREAANIDESRPGPFRFARPGTLARALEAAGFREVEQEEAHVPWPWLGSAEACWEGFLALCGPSMRAAVNEAALCSGRDVTREAIERLRRYQRQAVTDPGAQLIVVSGRVPDLGIREHSPA